VIIAKRSPRGFRENRLTSVWLALRQKLHFGDPNARLARWIELYFKGYKKRPFCDRSILPCPRRNVKTHPIARIRLWSLDTIGGSIQTSISVVHHQLKLIKLCPRAGSSNLESRLIKCAVMRRAMINLIILSLFLCLLRLNIDFNFPSFSTTKLS